jgi:polyhydroxyalkanoate synthesis regulator phasin
MFDILKNGLFAGLGAAVLSKEKVEATLKRLVDEGKISSQEAHTLADELIDSGQKEWSQLQEKVLETVRKGLDGVDVASAKTLRTLEERTTALEARQAALETRQNDLEVRRGETASEATSSETSTDPE